MTYTAPVETMAFALSAIADLESDAREGWAADASADVVDGILAEAGRFAAGRLAPLNRDGDRLGATLADGVVTQPPGWREAYQDWAQGGWNGIDLPADWGGMGLPTRLAAAGMEMWTSACMSFALGPVLTQGAVDTLVLHATPELQARYLPKLVSGEWTATMNLTEPQAGSDLGALRTRAVPAGDGTYRLFGQKIFITYGEHSLADNIVHLVLARLPDAPPGSRGISLFLVPKFIPNSDGSPGTRNDVVCAGLEHKLGIHASPTCMMAFGNAEGAVGWLVGEENRGLACMFTMMNKARLYTGLQGVAIAERATQQALGYARERRQGRAPGSGDATVPIIAHPDVRRNLATMRALTSAARAVAYAAASAIDRAHAHPDPAERARASDLAGLLTPITKAWCTDIGVEVTSIGVQVHGGMGYVEETGAAQHFRDARIPPIYEGTNGIQAIDLVTRKVLKPGSTVARDTVAGWQALAREAGGAGALAPTAALVAEACAALCEATGWIETHANNTAALLASATPYLRLWGTTAGAAGLLKGARAAEALRKAGDDRPVLSQAIDDARFFAANMAVLAPSLRRIVCTGYVPDQSAF
ncbi:acyl-CoA dehydrogenase [uncultured Alsobacter sp.]|uniref:acyl-CoA dehydrogenase n=1 Tax=uncultured Alsobacter sp. TaxID=1748258 RepID=UPI0025D0AA2B|nr:acyl-CoA dehydrogenase [uncultured Alsobacter sp.]